jgi:hypothetical protein
MDDVEWAPPIEVDTTTTLSTTGGHVWDAARRMYKFLSVMSSQIGLNKPGVTVLELGAGCGWLGINIARNLKDAGNIVLTEQVVKFLPLGYIFPQVKLRTLCFSLREDEPSLEGFEFRTTPGTKIRGSISYIILFYFISVTFKNILRFWYEQYPTVPF